MFLPEEEEDEDEASTPRQEAPSPQFFTAEEDMMPPTRPYTELDRNVVSGLRLKGICANCVRSATRFAGIMFGHMQEKQNTDLFFSFFQDLLNHTLGDIEIFAGQVAAVVAKNAKKKKKMKKGKGNSMKQVKAGSK